jgi:hypothetical protein
MALDANAWTAHDLAIRSGRMRKILAEAQDLPLQERVELAEELLQSVKPVRPTEPVAGMRAMRAELALVVLIDECVRAIADTPTSFPLVPGYRRIRRALLRAAKSFNVRTTEEDIHRRLLDVRLRDQAAERGGRRSPRARST